MCGISGIFGLGWNREQLSAMVGAQIHRGPDDTGTWESPSGRAALGHNRLSIIDLTEAGRNPMVNHDATKWIVFNGEIYNYRELRAELTGYPFRTQTDTEVILAAYERWGEACLERFIGMFAFLIWDEREQALFAARDRFGVKPIYFATQGDALYLASEIKALHAAGIPADADETAWASYLTMGLYDHTPRTFWRGVTALRGGHVMRWRPGRGYEIAHWYDLGSRVPDEADQRPEQDVEEAYRTLLRESVRLRLRSDVPVGICLSGGLDSSLLLALVDAAAEDASRIQAFTFVTGDERYDELPWVRKMIEQTGHELVVCPLNFTDVPRLATDMQRYQDEPFGGIPTLAYGRLFEEARARGVKVLLDGQGMDEQWAGYDYYAVHATGDKHSVVQGVQSSPVLPGCLVPEFSALAEPMDWPKPFTDSLRNLQYRDLVFTKIPRALRFNDRASMRSSVELREPFLDHRLIECALGQPLGRKIRDGQPKYLLRRMAAGLVPGAIETSPKRPLQTPQREWLADGLRNWVSTRLPWNVNGAASAWFDASICANAWEGFSQGQSDNSFFVWQWVSASLTAKAPSEVAIVQNPTPLTL